jgi:hypothetical protein
MASASAEEKISIKQKWIEGKTYLQDMTMKQNMTMGDQGSNNMDMKAQLGYKAMASDKPDETKIAMSYNKMTMKSTMNMGGQKIVMDSEDESNPQTPALRDSFAGLLNQEILIKINKKGEVTDVSGVNAAGNPMLGQMLSKETLAQMFDQLSMIAPEGKEAAKGDTWDANKEFKMPMATIKMKGKAKLVDIVEQEGRKIAKLELKGTASGDIDLKKALEGEEGAEAIKEAPGMKIDSLSYDITMDYDPELGCIVASKSTTNTKMTMSGMPGADKDKPMQMIMKQQMDMTTTVKDSK